MSPRKATRRKAAREKALRFLAGIGLAILAVPVARALGRQIWQGWIHPPSVHTVWFWGGAGFWIFLYLVMPRPVRSYVWAHEMTHVLWARLSGVKTWGLRVSERGGHVYLSRTSLLISLAPYLFPLYTLGILLLRSLLTVFSDQEIYQPFWMGAVGLTWAFHATFTFSFLREGQPDLRDQGPFFSLSLIILANVLGLALWLSLAEGLYPPRFITFLSEDMRWFGRGIQSLRSGVQSG